MSVCMLLVMFLSHRAHSLISSFFSQSRKFLAENFVEARRLTRYVEQFAEFLKLRNAPGGKA